VFGNPGSTELPVMDTLVRGRRIRYVLYIDLGSSLGVPGERVEKVSEVSGALARGFASGGPSVVDVIIDRTFK